MKKIICISLIILLTQGVFGNEKPYFITEPIEYLEEFDLYTYQIISADPDSEDSLYYIIVEKPDWLSFADYGNDTALLSGIPDQYYDSNRVIISVTDGIDTVYQEFDITILCLNCGPEITNEPVMTAFTNTQYSTYIEAIDCYSNVIFTADSIPDWINFDNSYPNMALLEGIPALSDAGFHYVSFTIEREVSICPTLAYCIYSIEVLPVIDDLYSSKQEANFLIYPNPFNNKISIHISGYISQGLEIEIFNSNGEMIKQKRIHRQNYKVRMDLDFLSPGLYFIRLKDEKNISIQKIMKL